MIQSDVRSSVKVHMNWSSARNDTLAIMVFLHVGDVFREVPH